MINAEYFKDGVQPVTVFIPNPLKSKQNRKSLSIVLKETEF